MSPRGTPRAEARRDSNCFMKCQYMSINYIEVLLGFVGVGIDSRHRLVMSVSIYLRIEAGRVSQNG